MFQRHNDSSEPPHFTPRPGFCSFCRRHYRDAGPMAEGPGNVCICYQCIQTWANIVQAEYRRLGMPFPDSYKPTQQRPARPIDLLLAEIAHLSSTETSVTGFYRALLPRVVTALAAVGGAIWAVDSQGHLELSYSLNIENLGVGGALEQSKAHTALLYQTASGGKAVLVPPASRYPDLAAIKPGLAAANPTRFLLIVGVIECHGETTGVIEVFQRPGADPITENGYLRFVMQMCDLASEFQGREKIP